jgi:acyl-CoA synthetase (AMP-forming)/AMP-acid ligase II
MVNWVLGFETQVYANGRRLALVCDGDAYTYAALNRAATGVAGWLADCGATRLGVVLPNRPAFVIGALGALKAGVPLVPVNYRAGAESALDLLGRADADALLTDATTARRIGRDDVPTDPAATTTVDGSFAWTRPFEGVLEPDRPSVETVPRGDEDLVSVSYTSGTTGTPKGVLRTHGMVRAQVTRMCHLWKLTPDWTLVCPAPLYHSGGFEGALLPTLRAGGTVVLQRWDVASFVAAVHAHHADAAWLAGSMLDDLHRYEDQTATLDPLWVLFTGGGPTDADQCDAVEARYGVRVSTRMGMTEAGLTLGYPVGTPSAYTPRAESVPPRVANSPGQVLTHGMDYRIVDERTGEHAPEGELQLRGDSVFERYLDDPEATAAAFTDDGWYRTGDVVREDEAGYVHHLGRADDVIVTGGENVSPRHVEGVIADHPDVAEAAVVGVPDERWGRRVRAVVVPREESLESLSPEAVIDHCKASPGLADYEVPKEVQIRESLPRADDGTVRRSVIDGESTDASGSNGG